MNELLKLSNLSLLVRTDCQRRSCDCRSPWLTPTHSSAAVSSFGSDFILSILWQKHGHPHPPPPHIPEAQRTNVLCRCFCFGNSVVY
eukprot:3937974-Amphidinium_carterae.1